MNDDSSPGWEAINAALRSVYGDQEPLHYGTVIKYSLGGPDPIDGMSAYASEATSPHWHFITYGFTELYAKKGADSALSGYGFELTFRLSRSVGNDRPPMWVFSFLQNLARYVFKSGNAFDAGHHLNLNGPIALDEETEIRAIAFSMDPQLPEQDTPHGKVKFLQIVGLSLDEYEAAKDWDTSKFLEVLASDNKLMITDLKRPSILQQGGKARTVREGIERDGSSSGSVYLSVVRWAKRGIPSKGYEVTIGAVGAADVLRFLKGRIRHGRGFLLLGSETTIGLEPGPQPLCTAEEEFLRIVVSPGLADSMCATLSPKRGTYRWPELPGLILHVEPSEIKDRDGRVVRVIG